MIVNKAWLDLLGYSKEEVIGKGIEKFLAPSFLSKFKKCFSVFKKNGEVHSEEFDMVKKDGSVVHVSFDGKVAFDEKGKFKQTHCILNNITQKKEAEKAIRESEERFRALSESSSESIYIHDGSKIIDCNKSFCSLTGYSYNELIGKDVMNLISPESRGVVISKLKSKSEQPYEIIGIRKDGKSLPVEVRGKNSVYKGKPVRVSVVRDITERKKHEDDLRSSAKMWESTFDSINDIICILNIDRKILRCNKSVERWTKNKRNGIIGKKCYEIFRCPIKSKKNCIFEKMLNSRKREISEIIVNGRNMRVIIDPIFDENKEIKGAVYTLADITESKKIRDDLIESEKKFNKLFHSSPNMMALTRLSDSKIIDVNDNFIREMGFMREEIIDHTTLELGIWKNPADRGNIIKRINPDGSFCSTELTLVTKSGDEKILFFSGQTIILNREPHLITTAIDITQKKKDELELYKANDLLRAIVEIAPIPLFGLDLKGNVTSVWNQAAEKMLGWTASEVMGRRLPSVSKEQQQEFDSFLKTIRSGKKIRGVDVSRQRKDGSTVEYSIYASPFFDKNGKVVGNIAELVDITERKKSERRILESEEKFRKFFESQPTYCYIISPEGKILDVNKSALEALGYSKYELVGKQVTMLYPHECKGQISQLFDKWLKTGKISNEETRIISKTGIKRDIVLNADSIRDTNGKIVCSISIQTDITNLKKVLRQLFESEKKYRAIFDESFDGLFITSPEGKILRMNKKGIEIFGYDTEEEMRQLDLKKDVYAIPEDRARIIDLVNKQGAAEYEVKVRKKRGDIITCLCSLVAQKEGEKILSYRGIIRDITEKKKQETELVASKMHLNKIINSSSEFIISVDDKGVITEWNDSITKKTGFRQNKMVGMNIFYDGVPPELSSLFDFIKNSLNSKKAQALEIRISDINHNPMGVLSNTSFIKGADGHIEGVVFIGRLMARKIPKDQQFVGGNSYLFRGPIDDPFIDMLKCLEMEGYSLLFITRGVTDQMTEKLPATMTTLLFPNSVGDQYSSMLFHKIKEYISSNDRSVIVLNILDYLIIMCGLKEAMALLYKINDVISKSENIVIAQVYGGHLRNDEFAILKDEFKGHITEQKEGMLLEPKKIEILKFISNRNSFQSTVNFNTVGSEFRISKKTSKKWIEDLQKEGLLTIDKKGRVKHIYVTEKGKAYI